MEYLSRKKKEKNPPLKAEEILEFKGIEMLEHTWLINLPNNVNSNDFTTIFSLFFNDEILLVLAGNTNAYAALKSAGNDIGESGRA